MIVAQYEVLGNDAKETSPSRKGRSKRSSLGLARRSAIASVGSIVPSGTNRSLKR